MDPALLVILAAFPFILLFILLIVLHWPAIKALPVVWALTIPITMFAWQIEMIYIPASLIRGTFMAMEIILIILGAVWLLEILKRSKHMDTIQSFLAGISPDARIQGIIIGWLFVSLMEGVAGFGTPAAVAAPLLVALGFTPVLAVSVALIANSVATTFGAAGTPVLLGLGNLGLERGLLEHISQISAGFHLIASIIIPLAIVYLVVVEYGKEKRKKINRPFVSMIPFSVFAWVVFGIPYLFSALFIGPELPSIIAAILSLAIVSIAAHRGFLVPKERLAFSKKKAKKIPSSKALFAALPYIMIVLLLMLTRTITPLRNLLQSIEISVSSILSSSMGFSYQPLFTPAFYFFLAGLLSVVIYRMRKDHIRSTLHDAFIRVRTAFIALIFALGLVQLFMASENNAAGIQGMPMVLAESIGNLFGWLYPLVAPMVGVFGSFISGSNTVSNILFGAFQNESAIALGISIPIILALQAVGGAIGNMIAIHNVLAASATVGLHHKESIIIRKTIVVAIIYALVVGALGLIAVSFLA